MRIRAKNRDIDKSLWKSVGWSPLSTPAWRVNLLSNKRMEMAPELVFKAHRGVRLRRHKGTRDSQLGAGGGLHKACRPGHEH